MSSRSGKKLTDEDRVLWNLVAKSATPMKGRKAMEEETLRPVAEEKIPPPAAKTVTAVAPTTAPKRQHVMHTLDRPTLDRLAGGKLPIEGRVDLHGKDAE